MLFITCRVKKLLEIHNWDAIINGMFKIKNLNHVNIIFFYNKGRQYSNMCHEKLKIKKKIKMIENRMIYNDIFSNDTYMKMKLLFIQ